MSKIVNTKGIVLTRTDFGEADRIITFLTPDHGKVRIIAKAVRKSQSKLAGGIELFSVSEIAYVLGRGDISTLTHSRLIRHYGNIVKDIDRTNATYESMRLLDKATEERTEPDYFRLLDKTMASLDDSSVDLNLSLAWFNAQLMRLSGHEPNLHSEQSGQTLSPDKTYDFDYSEMSFIEPAGRAGSFSADDIKLLRLCFDVRDPKTLSRVESVENYIEVVARLINTMLGTYVRV
jgi:DNA repair protein RecO